MISSIQIIAATEHRAQHMQADCASCSQKGLCLPAGLDDIDVRLFNQIISRRLRVRRGESLYKIGDPFRNLYTIRFGHFKTFQLDQNGEQFVTGFQMGGDLLGMDAIAFGSHECGSVALENSEVCEIPFSRLQMLFEQTPSLLHHFHRIMSHEIARQQTDMQLLSMHSTQRFAAFVVSLSRRYSARNYSSTRFQLRMSRTDISRYLGLSIESISRLMSHFKTQGWIHFDKREVELLQPELLKSIADGIDLDELQCKRLSANEHRLSKKIAPMRLAHKQVPYSLQ